MPLEGFPDLKIELDDNTAGTLKDISAYVTSINGWNLERVIEELTAAGDSDDRWADVGITRKGEVVLEGPYDDAVDGLVDITKVASDLGQTRTLQLTFDAAAADVEVVECIIQRVERLPQRGQFHGYRVTLRPTGAIT